MLLPFLVAAAMGPFYPPPRLIDPLDDIMRELTEEMIPAMNLQQAPLEAATPVHDYMINATRMSGGSSRSCSSGRSVLCAMPHQSIPRWRRSARRLEPRAQWAQAMPLGEQLLRLPDPAATPTAAANMKRFDAHIDRAESALHEAHSRRPPGAKRWRSAWKIDAGGRPCWT